MNRFLVLGVIVFGGFGAASGLIGLQLDGPSIIVTTLIVVAARVIDDVWLSR